MSGFVMPETGGTIETQVRQVPMKNGLKSQCRRIERWPDGCIKITTNWEDLGVSITFGDEEVKAGRFSMIRKLALIFCVSAAVSACVYMADATAAESIALIILGALCVMAAQL